MAFSSRGSYLEPLKVKNPRPKELRFHPHEKQALAWWLDLTMWWARQPGSNRTWSVRTKLSVICLKKIAGEVSIYLKKYNHGWGSFPSWSTFSQQMVYHLTISTLVHIVNQLVYASSHNYFCGQCSGKGSAKKDSLEWEIRYLIWHVLLFPTNFVLQYATEKTHMYGQLLPGKVEITTTQHFWPC